MSDQNDNPHDGDQPDGDKGKPEFRAPSSQEEFDRMVGARLERERARFADYEDVKAKAARFDEAEQASKSELERERERAEAAEKRASVAERTALQTRVATELGVPLEVVHGDDEQQMRSSAQKVLEWRDSGKKAPPPVKSLKSGAGPDGTGDGTSRAAAALRQLRQGS